MENSATLDTASQESASQSMSNSIQLRIKLGVCEPRKCSDDLIDPLHKLLQHQAAYRAYEYTIAVFRCFSNSQIQEFSVGILCFIFFLKNLKKSDHGTNVSAGLRREERATLQAASSSEDKVLSAASFKKIRVLVVTNTSHNTKLIRFEIPHGKDLGRPIGRNDSVRADVDVKPVMRACTPTSRTDQKRYFDLLVKTYEFGKTSSNLHSLNVGSSLDVRGPVGRFKNAKNSYEKMRLTAGTNQPFLPQS